MIKSSRMASLLVIVILGILTFIMAFQLFALINRIPDIKNADALTMFVAQISVISGAMGSCIGALVGILATTERTPSVPPSTIEADKIGKIETNNP